MEPSHISNIHIPVGINYDCSGCGHCCFGWPVPVTADDYNRITNLDQTDPELPAISQEQFRPMDTSFDPTFALFTHFLGKKADGRCEFLSDENGCLLHSKYGPESKPSICQLFPYTFTETPSGVYVSLNFGSHAVIFNSGRSLIDQEELLKNKWELFQRLMSHNKRNWSNIQLVAGSPLTWGEYLQMDAEMLKIILAKGPQHILQALADCSRYLVGHLPPAVNLDRPPECKAPPKVIDQLLLKWLLEVYLTDDVYACSDFDIYSQALLHDLGSPPPSVIISTSGTTCSISDIYSFSLGDLDELSNDLLYRMVYSRIFGKTFFGAGYANLSLVAGVHHLQTLIALVRVKIKVMCIGQKRQKLDFLEVVEIAKVLERRLTQMKFSPESAQVLDVILTSPQRIQRILSLAH